MIWPFLVLIIILGFYTSYSDIKEGKIRNVHVLTAFVLGLLTWYFLFILGLAEASVIGQTLLLGVYGLLIGFFIWLIGLWSAGDAKLFAVYSFLIPASIYEWMGFPLTSLISNTILPIFLVLILFLLIKSSWKNKKSAIKDIFNYKSLLLLLLVIFSLSWIVAYLFQILHIPKNYVFNLLGIFGLRYILKNFLLKYVRYILIGLAILRIIFEFNEITQIFFWKIFLLLTLGYVIVSSVFQDMSKKYFNKNIKLSLLKPGMIPAELITKEKNKYGKIQMTSYGLSQFKMETKGAVYDSAIEGLTKKDIKKINRLFHQKKLNFNTLKIQQTIPFAPFMFMGAILTILLKGNSIIHIITIIKNSL